MSDEITISVEEYYNLLADSRLLECLLAEGVDNWDGWDYALEAYNEEVT